MLPSLADIAEPFLDAAVMLVALVAVTRINGLRSFSKLSGFDFGITVAMGSVLASVVVGGDTPFLTGIAALSALFLVQAIAARLRVRSRRVEAALDNVPLLLMEGERVLDANLRRAKMTRADLIGKLREANVLDPTEIRAVVFETTGDVSVLHAPQDGRELSEFVLEGVARHHDRT